MAAQLESHLQATGKVDRRQFLNLAWLASLGILAIDLGVVTYLYALPRIREGEFGAKVPLGPVEDLPAVGDPPVNFRQGRFWLVRTEQGVLALYKVCTHLGCLYEWEASLDRFRCPCHGSEFLYDGTLYRSPAPRSLDRFVVRLVDPDTGKVVAETDPLSGGPIPLPARPGLLVEVETAQRLQGKKKGES